MLDGALSAVAVRAIRVWGLVLFCACRQVWQCGAVTGGPGLRLGGVFRLVCYLDRFLTVR